MWLTRRALCALLASALYEREATKTIARTAIRKAADVPLEAVLNARRDRNWGHANLMTQPLIKGVRFFSRMLNPYATSLNAPLVHVFARGTRVA